MKACRAGQWACYAAAYALSAIVSRAGDLTVDNLSVLDEGVFCGPVTIQELNGVVPTNGLVLYYSFSTNSATDESGMTNHGTVYGATWVTSGVPSGGYSFDGANDYIEASGNESLDLRTNLTMAAWVYFNGEGTANGIVVSKKTGSSLQYGMGRYSTAYGTSTHKFFAGLNAGGYGDYASDYVLDDGEWYFVAVTYNQQHVKLYVNGALDTIYAEPTALSGDSTNRLTVGADAHFPAWDEFANGVIDELRVYSRALSSMEITLLYLSYQSGSAATNASLTVEGPATLRYVVPQGDVGMGGYASEP